VGRSTAEEDYIAGSGVVDETIRLHLIVGGRPLTCQRALAYLVRVEIHVQVIIV